VIMSNRGQAHKVDEKWMSLCKQDGVSPAHNKSRVNLRTMSAGQLRRLEEKVEDRQGWELTRSREEVRELTQKIDDLDFEHFLEKEALQLRAKTQKQQAKDSLTDAEEKQDRLNALVMAAEESTKALERKLRLETLAADKALGRCERLAAAKEAVNINLEEKCTEMARLKASNEEAENELRKLRTHVKQLERELRRMDDVMKALTEAATLKEKKVAQAEERSENYNIEITELERVLIP
jgi:hypothetical protein